MSTLTTTPPPPYYAVVFTSQLEGDVKAYRTVAERMMELASRQPGFLGVDSAREGGGLGITVSYWRDEELIRLWKIEAEHLAAQQRGREEWYRHFQLRVARVERAYGQ